MSSKAKRVLAVWASLSSDERSEAVKLINEYQNADKKRKDEMTMESLSEGRTFHKSTTMNFGPLSGKCPYCGKQ